MTTHPATRIAFVFILLIMGFVAPLWVTAAFAVLGTLTMRNFIEGAIIVMIIDVVGRSDGLVGVWGWAVFLAVLASEFIYQKLWN